MGPYELLATRQVGRDIARGAAKLRIGHVDPARLDVARIGLDGHLHAGRDRHAQVGVTPQDDRVVGAMAVDTPRAAAANGATMRVGVGPALRTARLR